MKRCLGWCTSFLSLFLSIQREIKLVALVPIKFQQDNLSKFLFLSLSLSDDFLFNIGIVIFSLLLFFFFPPLPPDKKLPREKEDDASSTNVTDLTKIRLKLRRKL